MKAEMGWGRAGRLFSRAEWRRTGEQWISVACTSKEAIIVCSNHAGQISARSKKPIKHNFFFLYSALLELIGGDIKFFTSYDSACLTF